MKNETKVIKNLKTADILLIVLSIVFLPLAAMGVFILNEQPGIFQGLGGITGLIIGSIASVAFAATAFILSLVMNRNKTFRLSLGGILVVMMAALFLLSGS